MAATDKDTIYVDIDDEITGIIDKVKGSKSKVVALVLPKRASVFQSIVNMKLLKKAADSSSKNLVLITSEAGLMPLAGAAEIYVAKTLSSKPEIPLAPSAPDDEEEVDEDEAITPPEEEPLSPDKTVGELTGETKPGTRAKDGVETVALDNTEEEPAAEAVKDKAKDKGAEAKGKANKDKKLKIPNFNRFRKWLIIAAVALIALILIFLLANSSLATASINIKTNASNVPANLTLALSTSASDVNTTNGTIPAKQDTQQKTFSQQVGTTGQKNNGNKASGSLSLSAQACAPNIGQPPDVPAGAPVTSNGLTYITQGDTSFSSNPNGGHGSCVSYPSTSQTTIIAQSGGSNYNNATSFSVAGRSDVSASVASSISGGTDNIVQIVNQNDINSAKSKISAGNDNTVKSALESQMQGEGYFPIAATFNAGTPNVSSSANVGDTASSVTVTETISYTMFGVHKADLKALVDNVVDGQIDTSKQSILDEGLDSATFSPNSLTSSGGQVAMNTTAIAGPQLNQASIKQSAAGKKSGDVKSLLMNYPGVTDVNISLSPFWRTTLPNNTSKIKIIIAKPTNTKSS